MSNPMTPTERAQQVAPEISVLAESSHTQDLVKYLRDLIRIVERETWEEAVEILKATNANHRDTMHTLDFLRQMFSRRAQEGAEG